ncbi:MAG: cation acetate symporter [Pirellulales bacterium]|nr:cation acetate symporter [Pirellulales bacterium]
MIYEASGLALGVFVTFVLGVLGISFYLGSKAKSAAGYYAAHGQIPWFVNGVAFAGDYLSAASFLGICGMIAFYGYDGFLYSIGYLAGWIVALLVIAEPLKRLGKFTFADALDNRFHSKGIRLTAAISTLVVSIFYLIPQMVGAGALIRPLLGIDSSWGVVLVGTIVILIVVMAGMVSTTWVQFIKGGLLVLFCGVLTYGILARGLTTAPQPGNNAFAAYQTTSLPLLLEKNPDLEVLPTASPWQGKPYVRLKSASTGRLEIWRVIPSVTGEPAPAAPQIAATQFITKQPGQPTLANGLPQGRGEGKAELYPVGQILKLPHSSLASPPTAETPQSTGPLDPATYLSVLQHSQIVSWRKELPITESSGAVTTIYYPQVLSGAELLTPGGSPTFAGIRTNDIYAKLNFLSLMLALFAGTASLPHILIRYYTVKDQASARKSTVVGIASIGCFYILTLYLGLGAMTSGVLDPTDSNMAAPLLSRGFGELPFALISAIAFTTVLGTVSGLILAASGAVAHDLATGLLKLNLTDVGKVLVGKVAAVVVGGIGIVLGILFENFNVTFLVGWAFNIAASANLPALVMLLFWPRTTRQGITASILVGLLSSLGWVLSSGEAFANVYKLDPKYAWVPFNQPAIVTLPLSFLVLVAVSLATGGKGEK